MEFSLTLTLGCHPASTTKRSQAPASRTPAGTTEKSILSHQRIQNRDRWVLLAPPQPRYCQFNLKFSGFNFMQDVNQLIAHPGRRNLPINTIVLNSDLLERFQPGWSTHQSPGSTGTFLFCALRLSRLHTSFTFRGNSLSRWPTRCCCCRAVEQTS